jgi:hypothetical protein
MPYRLRNASPDHLRVEEPDRIDQPDQPELAKNMATLMKREGIGGIGQLRAKMADAGIKIGTPAIVAALKGSGGNRVATLAKFAAFFDVSVDQLLQPDLGREAERDEAAPPPPGQKFDALDSTDMRFLENLQVIKLDEDQLREVMEYVTNKAARLRAMQVKIEERVLAKYGIKTPEPTHSADAKKTAVARAALEVTEQLRQRSLLDDEEKKQ